jgi:hypothetical protein
MVKLHDLSISWKTAKQCKELIQELFEKLKESDFPVYENVSRQTVDLLGRAHESVRFINIGMTDDILLQTENDSMDQIQWIITGLYKRPIERDEVVIINLFHNGTQINLREI